MMDGNMTPILGVEKEELTIPEYEISQWIEKMKENINSTLSHKEKAIVNIAGASASGKGEATEVLVKSLEAEGKKVLVFSTDDFYKGISRMLSEGIAEKAEGQVDPQILSEILRPIIGDKTFDEKMSAENINALKEAIAQKMPNVDSEKLCADITTEFSQLDFDNPKAVDLDQVAATLAAVRQNQAIAVPTYSMNVSEPTGVKEIETRDFDVIIVEGIYGLNDGVLAESDVKSFIEADRKTLLMRRFRRDVLSGRTSFPPDVALWIALDIVLPAYKNHIEPSKKNAEMVLKNEYTGNETFDTEHYDVQDKIKLAEGELERLDETLGEPEKVALQHDYFFSSSEDDNREHLIRLRVENGRLKDLVHKGTIVRRNDGKVVRPTEEYIKDGQFGVRYTSEDEVLASFKNGGFELVAEINKTRKVFKKGNIEVVIDSIEGLGDYAEFRANDKLSKSPEVDEVVARLGLDGRKPVGPYVDEYISSLGADPEVEHQQEMLLNEGITRESVLEHGLCEVIESEDGIGSAFGEIRRGYPASPMSEQSHGREFRQASEAILNKIAETTLGQVDPTKAVVLFPWRSGIAFGKSFLEKGVDKFYHLSSKRDEETLSTIVDYESGEINADSVVVISDPMLATGNTIIDAIERMLAKGVAQENIYINSVVAAPVGVGRVKKEFPNVNVVVGALDEKLDHRGYIVPGLGDFGDKYFANLAPEELTGLVSNLGLDQEGEAKLLNRIKKQGVSEVLSELIQRDLKDQETDRLNQENLMAGGLEPQKAKRVLKIDTGRINSVEEVVGVIASEVNDDVKILSIEGSSGTGKSTTARELTEKINGQMISMGEVFRYLTFNSLKGETDLNAVLARMHYQESTDGIVLMDGEAAVSANADLRSKEVETATPELASVNQKIVIEFVANQLQALREKSGRKILIEGRSYTLDFLPSDIRVKLMADPSVRAERRWNQVYNNKG